MDLSQLQRERNEWIVHNFPTDSTEGPILSILGGVEEVGELGQVVMIQLALSEAMGRLAHAYIKDNQSIRGTHEEHVEAMLDAVADAVIFLCGVCTHLGADYGEVVRDTWEKVKQRDWIRYPNTGLPSVGSVSPSS